MAGGPNRFGGQREECSNEMNGAFLAHDGGDRHQAHQSEKHTEQQGRRGCRRLDICQDRENRQQ